MLHNNIYESYVSNSKFELQVKIDKNISYILIVLYVRDVTVMLPVLHFLWQNRPLYINCRKVQFRMHPWRYLNALKEWTEFSRRVSADHWTQRKVTVRAPVDDCGRYLNARKEWTKFSRQVSADHWTKRKVLHFLYITTPGWLTAGKCSSECIHEGIFMRRKNGWNSRSEFPPTTGHREKWRSEHRSTTVEGIIMRGKNGRNSRGKFPPSTGHRKKFCIFCILLHLDD